jgi:hypothetical protein
MPTEEPNAYLEKVREKRKRNQDKIEKLGLTDFSPKPKPKKQRAAAVTPPRSASDPRRRSSRVSKKPIEFVALDYEAVGFERRIKRRKHTKTAKKQTFDLGQQTTPEERAIFEPRKPTKKGKKQKFDMGQQITPKERAIFEPISSEEWLEDMEHYYSVIVGNSASNVQRVMCTTRKLASGQGVQHPSTQKCFMRKRKVNLGMDLREILDEASEWVYDNGGDRGNGWLIEHPVKKIWIYQQSRAQNKNKPFSK